VSGNGTFNKAEKGMLETVMWLLREGGANIGEVEEDGDSALILAVFGKSEVVKLSAGCCRKGKQALGRSAMTAARL
jgi:ankyrin repeat protein